jgi:hypothetical protein
MTYGIPLIFVECKGHMPTKHQFCLIQIKEIYDINWVTKTQKRIYTLLFLLLRKLRKLTKLTKTLQ